MSNRADESTTDAPKPETSTANENSIAPETSQAAASDGHPSDTLDMPDDCEILSVGVLSVEKQLEKRKRAAEEAGTMIDMADEKVVNCLKSPRF